MACTHEDVRITGFKSRREVHSICDQWLRSLSFIVLLVLSMTKYSANDYGTAEADASNPTPDKIKTAFTLLAMRSLMISQGAWTSIHRINLRNSTLTICAFPIIGTSSDTWVPLFHIILLVLSMTRYFAKVETYLTSVYRNTFHVLTLFENAHSRLFTLTRLHFGTTPSFTFGDYGRVRQEKQSHDSLWQRRPIGEHEQEDAGVSAHCWSSWYGKQRGGQGTL